MNFNLLVLPTNILSNILTKFQLIFVLSIYRFGIKIQKNRQCECHHRVATTAAAAAVAQWRRLRLRRRRQGPVQVQGNIVHFERPLTSELTFFGELTPLGGGAVGSFQVSRLPCSDLPCWLPPKTLTVIIIRDEFKENSCDLCNDDFLGNAAL